ncbi:MAG TPA: hypothetical protein VM327_03840 [Candidatus Thermoplasmatota archaeon]|nr:hypothetical protein [Candidatus Thermoplasmatota archaeon]
MANLRFPAVGVGLVLFIAAAVAGVLFIWVGRGSAGAMWALAVLLGVVVAWTVVVVVRGNSGNSGNNRNNNRGNSGGRADEP